MFALVPQVEMYADKAGIFFVNTKKQANWTVEEMLAGHPLDKTQFATIVEERLGVKLISAHSPQAKGRIERLRGTLQDRLPIWLKHRGIADRDEANKAIGAFIQEYNTRFAVETESGDSSFVPALTLPCASSGVCCSGKVFDSGYIPLVPPQGSPAERRALGYVPFAKQSISCGRLEGLWLFTFAKFESVEWDIPVKLIIAELIPFRDQPIILRCRKPIKAFNINDQPMEISGDHVKIQVSANSKYSIKITLC